MRGINSTTELSDIERNPSDYGMPTLTEFERNPEKWLGRKDELFGQIETGSHLFRKSNLVRRHKYEIFGYRTTKLEEVERICLNNGYHLDDLALSPEIIPLGGGQCDFLVRLVLKQGRLKHDL